MPVSAVTTTEEIFKPMMYPNPFMHTTTTGGGALACAAAIAAINVTLRDRLWEGAATKGSYLIEKVTELAEEFPQVYKEVTGKGLLIGQHFQTPETGYKVAAELFKRGVLVAGTLTSAQTIRIEPPLNGFENVLGLTVVLPDGGVAKFGGKGLEGANQQYTYFTVAQNGTFLIKQRKGEATSDNKGYTPNAAVKTPDASGKSVNALEVRVAGDTVSYVVNGTVVHTTPKSALSATDGTVGFRVNHVTEVQVDGFEVQKS